MAIRVLIAEDEIIVAKDISNTLEKIGYKVIGLATTGEEAIDNARETKPDIVLMDIRLKGNIDGIEATRQIHQVIDIPVIYITAYADSETIARAKATSPFGYLVKPFNERELQSTIEITLRRHELEKKLKESEMRYRTLFENASDMIQIMDSGGRFIKVNSKWLDCLQYSETDIANLHFTDIVINDQRSMFLEILDQVRDGSTFEDIETVLTKNDGNVLVTDGTITPIIENGTFIHSIGIFRDMTERKTKESILLHEREMTQRYLDIAGVVLVVLDINGRVSLINKKGCAVLGYSKDDVIGKDWVETFVPEKDRKRVRLELKKILQDERTPEQCIEISVLTSDSKERIIAWHNTVVRNNDGKIVGTLSSGNDITERAYVEQALVDSEQRYRDLVEQADVAIAINDRNGTFTYVNKRCADLFGYKKEDMENMSVDIIVHPDDIARVRTYHLARMDGKFAPSRYEFKGLRKDGRTIFLEIHTIDLKHHGQIKGTCSYIWNVSSRIGIEARLRDIALSDELTGLYNRRGFYILISQQIKLANRNKTGLCVLFADLDRMKWINDTLGHHEGDMALKEVAKVLRKTFRKSDLIARFGGDEFAICAIDAKKESADKLIERLQKIIYDYNNTSKHSYTLSLSTGTAFYDPKKPQTAAALIKKADSAMYKNKRKKKR